MYIVPNFTILSISLLPAKQPLAIIYCLEYWWIAKVSSNFDMRKNESSRLPSWENDELILQFEKWQCWTLWKGKTTTPSSSSKVESDTVLHTSNAPLATDIVYYSFGWLEALIDSIKLVTIWKMILMLQHMNWILWGYEVGIVVTCYQWENNLDLLSFPFG